VIGPRTGSEFDDLASDYRKASEYDPYHTQRLEERRQAKLDRSKKKLREKSGKGPSRAKALREPHTSIAKVESDRSRKNSRVKGNRGELDVAKVFSMWCGELVRRTPMSGGWSSAKFGVTADLVCTKKAFPFHVEVKHREGWTLDDLVTGAREDHDKSIVQWWLQCLTSCPADSAQEYLKVPLLVFRRNRQPWLVMVREEDVKEHDALTPLERTIVVKRFGTRVCLLEDLLKWWPVPKRLKNHGR
jgi:hypothetical protein